MKKPTISRWVALLFAMLLVIPMRTLATEIPSASDVFTQLEVSETFSYVYDVPGRGPMRYYAQNDPIWSELAYLKKSRDMGRNGCEPTAYAIAFAYFLEPEQLPTITLISRKEKGYAVCTCAAESGLCRKRHERYQLTTGEEYLRYLPVVIADYAQGNNVKKRVGTGFFPGICNHFDLKYKRTRDREKVMSALEQGAIVVAISGTKGSPFTGGGHYVTIVSTDETYLYIMDPFQKESYEETDKKSLLEQISPGVLRTARENLSKLCFTSYYIIYEDPDMEI